MSSVPIPLVTVSNTSNLQGLTVDNIMLIASGAHVSGVKFIGDTTGIWNFLRTYYEYSLRRNFLLFMVRKKHQRQWRNSIRLKFDQRNSDNEQRRLSSGHCALLVIRL
jgi:hypothetical protein